MTQIEKEKSDDIKNTDINNKEKSNLDNSEDINSIEKDNSNKSNKSFKDDVIDFLKDLIIVIIIVVFIRSFLVLPFQISGQSMYDSYYDKQFIIVDVLSYLDIPLIWKISAPKNWDVIVFRPWVNESKEYYIKRIVASQWETLKIIWWEVFLKKEWKDDFVLLDETFLDSTNYWKTFVSTNEKVNEYLIPEDSYFVMWDNRNWSSDSRSCFTWHCDKLWHSNFIKNEDIVWRVMIDLWYFNFKVFKFIHPYLWIDTTPKFFSWPDHFDYE